VAAVQQAPDTPLKDQRKFIQLIDAVFASGAKKAARYNDNHGYFTPVGVNGAVRYVLNKLPPDRHKIVVPDFLKKGYDANKRMWVVGGPNAAGKTTLVEELFKVLGQTNLVRLNADVRTKELHPLYPIMLLPERNLMAAQQIDAEVMDCIKTDRSFLVETVLSSGKYRDDVILAKEQGFKIIFLYVSLFPEELSPARVQLRVLKKGHDVDPEKAIKRYRSSHKEAAWFAQQADAFIAFDNSALDRKPIMVAAKLIGEELVVRKTGVNPNLDKVVRAAITPLAAPIIG